MRIEWTIAIQCFPQQEGEEQYLLAVLMVLYIPFMNDKENARYECPLRKRKVVSLMMMLTYKAGANNVLVLFKGTGTVLQNCRSYSINNLIVHSLVQGPVVGQLEGTEKDHQRIPEVSAISFLFM